jgi:alkanesulfonate monooxygenase SsuD/methylene tetrahydromethanopterin reductase-like flavin-dependent oxidoreductase (luciferase family)
VSFKQLYSLPFPVQKHIPLWFGIAPTQRNIEQIAEMGDGWLPMERDPDKLKEPIAKLQAAFKARGRDPKAWSCAPVCVRSSARIGPRTWRPRPAQLPELISAGVNIIDLNPSMFCKNLDQAGSFFQRILELKTR